jgi:hypothetical protein
MRKRLLLFTVLLTFSFSAFAWLPILIVGGEWLAGAATASRLAWVTNAGLRASQAKSLSLHAGIAGVVLTAPSVIENTPSGKLPAHVMIDLNDGGTRLNPDPNRYNDATDASVDPIPKNGYSPTAELPVLPGQWPAVITEMGAPAFQVYRNSAGTRITKVTTYRWQVGQKAGADYATTAGFPSTDPNGVGLRKYNQNQTTGTCGTSSTNNCEYIVVYSQADNVTCAQGYTLNNNTCTLQDAGAVIKPEKVIPCEVTRDASGGFAVDEKNPDCLQLQQSGQVKSINKDVIEVSNPAESAQVRCTPAECDIAYTDKANNTWSTIKAGAPDGQGVRPVTSIENGTGTNPGLPGGPGEPGNGDGCGSSDKPCSVDVNDSGFKDLNTDPDDTLAKLEANQKEWTDRIDGVTFDDTHGVDIEWIPQIPRRQCVNPTFGIGDHVAEIDLCENSLLIKSVLAWLLYLYTAYFLVNLFFERSVSTGK